MTRPGFPPRRGHADNFPRTAEAMMVDARTLRASNRHRNACYLAGYVVECTLKALIQSTPGERPEWTHDLGSLRDQVSALSLAAGHAIAKHCDPMALARSMITGMVPAGLSGRSRHCDWDPIHRYDGSRWDDPDKSRAYVDDAERALRVLAAVQLDGGLR